MIYKFDKLEYDWPKFESFVVTYSIKFTNFSFLQIVSRNQFDFTIDKIFDEISGNFFQRKV